jgi:hypothetical protein
LENMGYTTAADGTQFPLYKRHSAMVQAQGMTTDKLRLIDGMNIQGSTQVVYLNGGEWEGVLRPEKTGGDLIEMAGGTWLVLMVVESWPDWTAVIVVLQNQ